MKHDFGELKEEEYRGKKLPVWESTKYKSSKAKAIEMIDSGKYNLEDNDFWILKNKIANGTKMMYSGLIISHNGCLKINDVLDNHFEAKYLTREWINDTLIYEYNDGELYEIGEVSPQNCQNEYPYAMAFKRCFDRVVLKKSKLAFSGILSEVEADEFKPQKEDKEEQKEIIFDEPEFITNEEWQELTKLYSSDEVIEMMKELNVKKPREIPRTYYLNKVYEKRNTG